MKRKKKNAHKMFYNETKKYIVLSLILILGGSILGYTYNRTEDLIRGPRITITSPENGATLTTSLIEIEGTAYNISKITLNDRDIFVDENGALEEKLLLSEGYNKITLKAEDKFNRKTEKTLELIYSLL